MMLMQRNSWHLGAMQSFSLLLTILASHATLVRTDASVPVYQNITINGGVLLADPYTATHEDGTFSGFLIDLLRIMEDLALQDGYNLTFNFSLAEDSYSANVDLIANDCNTTVNPNSLEDCNRFDMIVGDYYTSPTRFQRIDFSSAWAQTSVTTVRYIQNTKRPSYTTLEAARRANEPICVLGKSLFFDIAYKLFPDLDYVFCSPQSQCLEMLKQEDCVLHIDDELQLRFEQTLDPTLDVTNEQMSTEFVTYVLSKRLDSDISNLLQRWLYAAMHEGASDMLSRKYFEVKICPIGFAGKNCQLPCDVDHGHSNRFRECICNSERWTGPDCSIEVLEDVNLIPETLRTMGICLFLVNLGSALLCAIWLYFHRRQPQVKVSQPIFLSLVLLGCVVSSSSILALAVEDSGDGPVKGCMLIPWLYSVGFCITFGTLFAKIRRVHVMFHSALMYRRVKITVSGTLREILMVLTVDVIILLVWTLLDPLKWKRRDLVVDKFGDALVSEGFCTSTHWKEFSGLLASFHFLLLSVACYLCYKARKISNSFSEGKVVAVAMISNLQIFVVGLPVLVIVGSDPELGFFVRSLIIWMNDFVVLVLVFGKLIARVYNDYELNQQSDIATVTSHAIRNYVRQSVHPSKGRSTGVRSQSAPSHLLSEFTNYSRFGLETKGESPQSNRDVEDCQGAPEESDLEGSGGASSLADSFEWDEGLPDKEEESDELCQDGIERALREASPTDTESETAVDDDLFFFARSQQSERDLNNSSQRYG